MKRRHTKRLKKQIHRVTVVMTLLLLAFIVFTTFEPSQATSSTGTEYILIQVKEGDTLWNIAKQRSSDGDIREMIYEIKKLNKLENTTIHPGQQLSIPVEI